MRTVTTLCFPLVPWPEVVRVVSCIFELAFVVTILNLSKFFTEMFLTKGMVRVRCKMLDVVML